MLTASWSLAWPTPYLYSVTVVHCPSLAEHCTVALPSAGPGLLPTELL